MPERKDGMLRSRDRPREKVGKTVERQNRDENGLGRRGTGTRQRDKKQEGTNQKITLN